MTAPAFQITVQPSGRQFAAAESETILAAAIHAGVGLPYGCKDGACGSCKCKKLSGEVTHDTYSDKALSPQELADGFVLTCRATAHTDVVLESRQVTDLDAFPIKKMPVRVSALEKLSHDVMRVQLQLPAHTVFQYFAGQYIEFTLRDGSRRAYSIATPPHLQTTAPGLELHIRHMPGGLFTDHVFDGLKEKEILRIEGPFGSFFLREDSDKPMVFLASGTGFAPIKGLLTHMQHATKMRGCKSWLLPCPTCVMYLSYRTRSPTTTGQAAQAMCTKRYWMTSQTSPAMRCMPAVRPSWWTLPAPAISANAICLKRPFLRMPSPARLTSKRKKRKPKASTKDALCKQVQPAQLYADLFLLKPPCAAFLFTPAYKTLR